MIGTRTLIEKADLDVATMLSDGGALVAAQAKTFIRTLIDESTLMPMATVTPMRSTNQRIDKARFGSRVLRAGEEGTALSAGDRAKPDLDKEELVAKLFKAEIRLSNEVLQDSIEGGNLRGTVLAMLGDRIGLDMDEWIAQADTTNATDPFLAKGDGIIKLATPNVVDVNSGPISRSVFKDMLKTLPQEFLRDRKKMRYLVSVDTEIEYRDVIAQRETALGDKYVDQDSAVAFSGVPIVEIPVFPENLGVGTDETVCILTDPKNINVGIWRQVTMETDKDISAGALIIVATLRFDVKFIEKKATVKAIKIKR